MRSGIARAAAKTHELDDPEPANQEDGDNYESSNWDYYGEEYYDGGMNWKSATIPARRLTTATSKNTRAARNLLASNIGLIAKRGPKGKLLVGRDGAGFGQAARRA